MKISVDKIIVGERLRQDNGDIAGLARSIQEHGLLHPVVIDATYNLVAGGRRLLATKEIGYKEIEVKMIGELTEKELRILELEENIKRKDLTEIEKSRNLVELAESKIEILKNEKEEQEVLAESAKTDLGGRPTKNGVSLKEVSDEICVPRKTLHDAKQHVAAVDKYPKLEELPKHEAIKTSKELDKISDKDEQEKRLNDLISESNKKIDAEYRRANKVEKLINSGLGANVTDEELDCFLEYYDDPIDEHINRIHAIKRLLDKIEHMLQARQKIRRVK